MANRRSQNWLNQQRVDVPHLRSIESAVRNDFDELLSSFAIGESASYFIRGFEISMVGAVGSAASSLQLIVDEAALFHGKSNTSGTFFQVNSGTPNETLNSTVNTKVDGAFTPSSLNYIGLELKREVDAATVSQLFFWNPTNKTEFSKTTPLAQTLDYEIVISSTVWDSNVLPLSIVQTDSSNAVLSVEDRRPMLFRLGTAGETSPDPFYEYPWNNHAEGRTENPFESSSTTSPFRGGDKQIKHFKEWADAIMSQIKELKGTTYWYSFNQGGSILKLRGDIANTMLTGPGSINHSDAVAGLLTWDLDIHMTLVSSRLKYTLTANPVPGTNLTLNNNDVAYINIVRGQAITPKLIFINGSAIVTSVGAVAWTSDILVGDYIKVAAEDDTKYYKVLSIDSTSQVTLDINYIETSTGSLGTLAEYAYGNYQVVASPTTDRHIQVAQRELVPFNEDAYWIFLRDDNGGAAKVYIRGVSGGELAQGETRQISDNTTEEVLLYIGSLGEANATPKYQDSIVTSVAEVTTYTLPAASALTAGQYFELYANDDLQKYHAYVIKDGTDTPPAVAGSIAIPFSIVGADTAINVGAAFHAAINAIADFNSVDNNDGTVTVTNANVGATTDAANVDMGAGFSITIDTQGTGSANYALIDDENLTIGIKRVDESLGQLAAQVNADTWKLPVPNFAALPAAGNLDGDVRLVLDTRVAYHWDASQLLWLPLTGGAGIKVIGGGTIFHTESAAILGLSIDQLTHSNGITLNETFVYGQTFTPATNFTVNSAALRMYRDAGLVGNATFKIVDVSGGNPNLGSVVATSDTVDVTTFSTASTGANVVLNFSTPPVLVGGTQYALIFDGAGLSGGTYSFRQQTGNPYAGGFAQYTGNGGASWTEQSQTRDAYFQITQNAVAAVPEIQFTSDMFLEKAGLLYSANTIPISESPIILPNNQDVAYVEPNLVSPGGNLTVVIDTLDNVPPTAVIVARRDGTYIIVGSSSTKLALGESIELYDTKTDQDKDKMRGADYGYFRSNEEITWTGERLLFTQDIVFETTNRNGNEQEYTVLVPTPVAITPIETTTSNVAQSGTTPTQYGLQTFTATSAFDVSQVRWKMDGRNSTGSVRCEIWELTGGIADPTKVLATSTPRLASSFTSQVFNAGAEEIFVFPTPPSLTNAVEYAAVIVNVDLGGAGIVGIYGDSADVYAGGAPAVINSPFTNTGDVAADTGEYALIVEGITGAAGLPIPDGFHAYIEVNRNNQTETVSFQVSNFVPALPAAGRDIIVFAKRRDLAGGGYLHLPLHKQVLEPGQTVRLGASGTGGSGGNSFTETLKNRLQFGQFSKVTPYIASEDKDDTELIDATSTGAFAPASKKFELPVIGNTLLSANMLNATFLANDTAVNKVEAAILLGDADIGENVTVEVSRDNSEFQAITMTRLESSNLLTGFHVFDNEATVSTISEEAIANAGLAFTDTALRYAQPITIANKTLVRNLFINIQAKTGSPLGNMTVSLVKDNAGNPSEDRNDYLTSSAPVSIDGIVAGELQFSVPTIVAAPGDYHIVIEVDNAYAVTYNSGVDEILINSNSGGSGALFYDNGGAALIPFSNLLGGGSPVTLSATTDRMSQSFTTTASGSFTDMDLNIVAIAGASGNMTFEIREDNAGEPGTLVTNGTSDIIDSSSFGGTFSPANNILWSTPPALNAATKYWVVLNVSTIVFGGGFVQIARGASDNIAGEGWQTSADSGATWTATDARDASMLMNMVTTAGWKASTGSLTYRIEGFAIDLRMRLTSVATDTTIEAFGVFYDRKAVSVANVTLIDEFTKFSFQAVADNTTSFVLPFMPNKLLVVSLQGSGQTFTYGDFSLQGNTVVFPDDQFNNGGVEKVQTVVFDQTRGGSFDNSDVNAALLAANHLGSSDGSIDMSVAGRGIILQRPDGTKREVAVDNNDNLTISTVD